MKAKDFIRKIHKEFDFHLQDHDNADQVNIEFWLDSVRSLELVEVFNYGLSPARLIVTLKEKSEPT